MSRDKALGGTVLIICIIVFLLYTYYALAAPAGGVLPFLPAIGGYWVLAVPIWLGITILLFIGAWIGWTLLTTPAPEPIESLEEFEEPKEEKSKEEEVKG